MIRRARSLRFRLRPAKCESMLGGGSLTTVTASCELEVINDLDIPIACKFLIEDS